MVPLNLKQQGSKAILTRILRLTLILRLTCILILIRAITFKTLLTPTLTQIPLLTLALFQEEAQHDLDDLMKASCRVTHS